MPAGVRDIKVRFGGDASGIERAADRGGRAIGGFGDKAKKFAKAAAVGLAAVGAVGVVVAKQAVQAAADQSANFSKYQQVTKKAMDSTSKVTARSLNLSQSSYADYYAQLSAMYQSNGIATGKSNSMAAEAMKTSADAAAFGNTTVGEAVEAQLGLLKGSGELWEKYSVSIKASDISAQMKKQGLDKLTGAEKKAAEATVRHNLAQKAAKLFLGQAAKESGSLESRQQKLKATVEDVKAALGKGLLPIVEAVLGKFQTFVGWIEANWPKWKAALKGPLEAVGGVFQSVGKYVGEFWSILTGGDGGGDAKAGSIMYKVGDAALALRRTFKTVKTFVVEFFAILSGGDGSGDAKPGSMLYKVGEAALWVRNVALPALRQFADWFVSKAVPAVKRFLTEAWAKLQPAIVAVAKVIRDDIVPAAKGLIERFQEMWPSIQRFLSVLGEVAGFITSKVIPVVVRIAGPVLQGLIGVIGKVISFIVRFSGVMTALAAVVSVVLLPAMVRMIANWIRSGTVATANAAKNAAAWVKTQLAAYKSLAVNARAFAAVIAGWVRSASMAMKQAVRMAAAWAIAGGPVTLLIAAIALIAGALVLAYKKFDWFRFAINGVIKVVGGAWLTMISTMLTAVGKLAGGLGHLPGKLGAPFRAAAKGIDAAKAKVDELRRKLDELPTKKTIKLTVEQQIKTYGGTLVTGGVKMQGGTTTARAAGGPVSRGMSYLVGERGPEMFSPGRSGSITPNHELGGGGGTTVVEIHATGPTLQDIVRVEVREASRATRNAVRAGASRVVTA